MTPAPRAAGTWSSRINDDNYMWWAAIPVILGMFIVIMDNSILNVALPHIMAAFGSGVDDIEWVSTGYLLSSAIMMPTTGFLGDRFGRKRLYVWAVLLFTLASGLCGLAWDTGSLVFFRVLQGLVGGAIQPVSQAIIFEAFPTDKRGMSMALIGIGAMFAPMFGPTLGGYLVEYLDWRWIFFVNLPVGLFATFMSAAILRESATRKIGFDAWGFVLMATCLSTLLLGLSEGNSKGWGSDEIVVLLAIACVSFAAFLVVELSQTQPVIDLSLFGYPTYTAGTLASIVMGVGLFGGLFLMPVFLQNLMGYDAVQTGLLLMPQGLAVACMMPIAGKLIQRVDPRFLMVAGLALMSESLFLQAGMSPDTPTWDIIGWTLLRGVGMGLAFPAMNQTALGAVPIQRIGQASGLFNVMRQIGGSFGIAWLTLVLSGRQSFHSTQLAQQAAQTSAATDLLAAARQTLLWSGDVPDLAQQQAFGWMAAGWSHTVSVMAFQDAFYAAAWAMLAGIVPALLMSRTQRPGASAPPAHLAAD